MHLRLSAVLTTGVGRRAWRQHMEHHVDMATTRRERVAAILPSHSSPSPRRNRGGGESRSGGGDENDGGGGRFGDAGGVEPAANELRVQPAIEQDDIGAATAGMASSGEIVHDIDDDQNDNNHRANGGDAHVEPGEIDTLDLSFRAAGGLTPDTMSREDTHTRLGIVRERVAGARGGCGEGGTEEDGHGENYGSVSVAVAVAELYLALDNLLPVRRGKDLEAEEGGEAKRVEHLLRLCTEFGMEWPKDRVPAFLDTSRFQPVWSVAGNQVRLTAQHKCKRQYFLGHMIYISRSTRWCSS